MNAVQGGDINGALRQRRGRLQENTIPASASNGGDNQKWRVVDKGQGTYQLVNKKSSKLAEVPAGATADGIALDQRTASFATNQLWQMSVAN